MKASPSVGVVPHAPSRQDLTKGDCMLMYRYENGNRGAAWIPHDQVQDGHYAFWNPDVGQIRDADTTDGEF